MRIVSREELSERGSEIVDEILATGESVEIVNPDRRSVIMAPKPATLYEVWKAQGLIKPAKGRLSEGQRAQSPRSAKELLDEVRGDR